MRLEELDRARLAQLGREYMHSAQFNSRAGYAGLQMNHGPEYYKDVAIDNWMAVSPIYTQRMQRAMGFAGGDDVATIFKGLQLEVGFSHQYFDTHFEVKSSDEGFFWLQSCGPLLEVEPRGEEAVRVMCHDIEDPTFDATAVATNPRAKVRPVHRPPRVPADQAPHCRWRVFIDHDAEPLTEVPLTRRMRGTQVAQVAIPRPESGEPGGMDYYDGEVFEQLHLERFSQAALVVICKEVTVQCHLLAHSMAMAIAERLGEEAALANAEFQMTGSTWPTSERLCRWLGLEGNGLDDIAQVLSLHPWLRPSEYLACEITAGDDGLQLAFGDCPAAHEQTPYGVYQLLASGRDAGLESLVRGVDNRATLSRVEGKNMAWRVHLDEKGLEREEPLAVQIAKGTLAYTTQLEDHITLLQA